MESNSDVPTIPKKKRNTFLWKSFKTIGLIVLAFIVFVGIGHTYFGYIKPMLAQKAFAKLTGEARRLAIYDTFCDQVEANYYDRSFAGMDWKKLRTEWRLRAAQEPDDIHLYNDVFIQISQKFPVSHVNAIWPQQAPLIYKTEFSSTSSNNAETTNRKRAFSSNIDLGFELAAIRRGKLIETVVGDVYKGSPAEQAGIEPGWPINKSSYSSSFATQNGTFNGDFFRLNTFEQKYAYEQGLDFSLSKEMHAFEQTQAASILGLNHGSVDQWSQREREKFWTEDQKKKFSDSLIKTVHYNFNFVGPRAEFVTHQVSNGIQYIRFDVFEREEMEQVLAAVYSADAHRGLILDLRSNMGGKESELIKLLSCLLPANTIFADKRSVTRNNATLRTSATPKHYDGPLIILTGPVTASAAEVTAAALQDSHRAKLIGRVTNGSVLSSEDFPLPDGGSVRVPTADIWRIDGKHIEGVGVYPDIEVIPTLADIRVGRDVVLERAQAELQSAAIH